MKSYKRCKEKNETVHDCIAQSMQPMFDKIKAQAASQQSGKHGGRQDSNAPDKDCRAV